jgi:toxin ParE1/3/4
MAEVRWTPQAIEDIENIAKYIANDSPKYAAIQVEEFFEAALTLEEFPHSGRIVPEIGSKNIRELIVGFYRLIYRIRNLNLVEVITVYHSYRLLNPKEFKKKK